MNRFMSYTNGAASHMSQGDMPRQMMRNGLENGQGLKDGVLEGARNCINSVGNGNGIGRNMEGHLESARNLGHHFGGFGILEGIVAFFLIAILIAAVIYIIRYLFGGKCRNCHCEKQFEDRSVSSAPTPIAVAPKSDSRAIEILKERYAKGEIGKEEFENIRRDIS